MDRYFLAATAVYLMASGMPAAAQDSTSRQQNEAPVSAQDRPPEPEDPRPGGDTPPDTHDYHAPTEQGRATVPRSVATPTPPPGAPETPSTSPAGTGGIEPSAGGAAVAAGGQPLDAYLEGNGDKRRKLIGKTVSMEGGETAGTLSEFVVRDGKHYAHLTLPKTADDRSRDVAVPLGMLSVAAGGQQVIIKARSRDDLKKLPEYGPENYQTVR